MIYTSRCSKCHTVNLIAEPTYCIFPFCLSHNSPPHPLFIFTPGNRTQQTSSFCFSHFQVEVEMWEALLCALRYWKNGPPDPLVLPSFSCRNCKLFISSTKILPCSPKRLTQKHSHTSNIYICCTHTHTHARTCDSDTPGRQMVHLTKRSFIFQKKLAVSILRISGFRWRTAK